MTSNTSILTKSYLLFRLQVMLLVLHFICFICYIVFNINYRILSINISLFLFIFLICSLISVYLYDTKQPFLKNVYIILLFCQIIVNILLLNFFIYLIVIKYPHYIWAKNYILFEKRVLLSSEILDVINYLSRLYNIELTLPEIEWLTSVSQTFTDVAFNLFEVEKKHIIGKYLESHAMYLALLSEGRSIEYTSKDMLKFITTNVYTWIGIDFLGLGRPVTYNEVISYCLFFSCLFSSYWLSKPYQKKSIEAYKNLLEVKNPTNPQLFVDSEFHNVSQEETDFMLILKKSAQEQKTNSIIPIKEELLLKELDVNISKLISREFLKKPPLRKGRDNFWEIFARENNHMGDEKSGYYGAQHLWSGKISDAPLNEHTPGIYRFFESDKMLLLKLKRRLKKNIFELDNKIESLFNTQISLIETKSSIMRSNLEELKYFINERNKYFEKYLLILELYENIFSYNSNSKIFEKYIDFFHPVNPYKFLKDSSEQIEVPKMFERGSRLDWIRRRWDRVQYPLCHELEPDSTVNFNTQIFGNDTNVGCEEKNFQTHMDVDFLNLINFQPLKNFTILEETKMQYSIETHYISYNVPIEKRILQWDAFDRRFNLDKIDFLISSFY